mgnify:CR=1 FL=1
MTNEMNSVRADRRLVAFMSPIGFGTIIKGWRGSKGLDYIVVGINTANKEIYAIKHNCINDSGNVHAAVTRHKRKFKYTLTASGRFGIVEGVTSVLGQKETLDFEQIETFNRGVDEAVSIVDFNSIALHTLPLVDRRKSSVYK